MAFTRGKSLRLKDYDYSSPGGYFVTICTYRRQKIFGEIVQNNMVNNTFGCIVEECWKEIPKHYKNVELDIFQVMPDHVHGILMIYEAEYLVAAGHARCHC